MFYKNRVTITLMIMLLIFITVVGCSKKESKKSEISKVKKENTSVLDLLIEGEWRYYDVLKGSSIELEFNKNNEFKYNNEIKSNVLNELTIYNSYKYIDEKNICVYLNNNKKEKVNIDILYIDKFALFLKVKNKMFELYNYKTCKDVADMDKINKCDKCKLYIDKTKGYNGYNVILMNNDNEIVITTPTYDGDIKEHRNYTRDIKFADNVEFYDYSAKTIFDKDGKLKKHSCDYKKLSMKDLKYCLEFSSLSGLIWYNDDLEVIKMLFFGETIIYE